MAVLKYNSVRYNGGVDIQNTVDIPRPQRQPEAEILPKSEDPEQEETEQENGEPGQAEEPVPRFTREEILVQRETELLVREREVEQLKEELAQLREQYIEQGKEVILEAKRRAEGIVQNARQEADDIISDAEQSRDDVFIKARAEGFEQGKRDGVAACLAEGQGVLDEAREYSDRINEGKVRLFERYEQEIFETVMTIANKVTLNSMAVKDGTAAKKLIKKAAKDFRNSQMIRITLDENGATTELAGDYEYLKELCGGVEHIEVELLADADLGTVIIDNGEEITDAGIQTQLKMIRELGSGKYANKSKSAAEKRKKKPAAVETELEEDDPED
ncbi:MAG: hypothetical protein K2N56_08630 [Oscillospiraceae bacterium]|nr:hypothetical protein [Oscillospiraceae bacterium]